MKKLAKKAAIAVFGVLALSACAPKARFASERFFEKRRLITESFFENRSSEKPSEHRAAQIHKADLGEFVAKKAQSFIGTPYKWGGETKNGMDCSGLAFNIFTKLGYRIPRTASQLKKWAKRVSRKDLKPGDLVFFKRGGRISHVGIYVGDNQIVHASSAKGKVIKQSLDDKWLKRHLAGFGRILN